MREEAGAIKRVCRTLSDAACSVALAYTSRHSQQLLAHALKAIAATGGRSDE
jgi:hypothetical protein